MGACNDPLKIKIELSVVEDLGIKLYGKLPPLISELVANAWDADASSVKICFPDGNIDDDSAITVKDDGHGMSYGEIQDKYLLVGRKRRVDDKSEKTPNGRDLMGRKGIGKLSVFGAAKNVEIRTVKDSTMNVFQMNVDDLLNSAKTMGEYEPTILHRNEATGEADGTTVTLGKLKRKTKIDTESVRRSIARHFSVIDDDFRVSVNVKEITPADKIKKSDMEYTWDYDGKMSESRPNWTVVGWIGATPEPLNEEDRGITILARGKMIQKPTFFDIKVGEKFSYSYMTGEITAEFFDQREDLISTNRQSLIWDTEEGEALKGWGSREIRKISNDLADKKREKRERVIREDPGLGEWLDSLEKPEKHVANKVIRTITSSDRLTDERRKDLMGYVVESFDQKVFRDMVDNLDRQPDPVALIEMFEEWNVIEAREITRIVKGRLDTIEKLGAYIDGNAKEVPTLHRYFKEWPWILEPTWTQWQDEIRFSQLLSKKYPDGHLDESDRRIDFLAIGVGDTIHVVELKRPKYRIGSRDLDQLLDYVEFVKENLGTVPNRSYHSVAGYLVAGGTQDHRVVRARIRESEHNRMYVKTYEDLIIVARQLHKVFEDKLEKSTRRNTRNS